MRTIIITAIVMLAVSAAHGQQGSRETFTDQRGNFAGSSVTRSNQTDYSDRRGGFSGSSIAHDGKVDHYDRNGRYQGTTTTTRPQR
jgi:hypothetical protein